MIRVLMLSKACIVGIYQRKLELIAQHGVELLVLVPPSWKDERGETRLERVYTEGYRLVTTPIRFNGYYHWHHYPEIGQHIRAFRPRIVHIDEEPYNLATWQALYHARRAGARTLFFSWQNLNRRYPPPFSWTERHVLRTVDHAIMGTESAAQVWREKGYSGSLTVIPQFGTDPDLFQPEAGESDDRPFTVGYFGRLVEEKGILTLIDALQKLPGKNWHLRIMGGGPLRATIERRINIYGLADRVTLHDPVPSTAMPAQYHQIDALVLPSLTRPNWMEQFGRVLVEAMASGVPVIGSNSGAIPGVIGDAGLLFPEGEADALATHLRDLQANADLRADLHDKGRARVLAHFTHEPVADATIKVYQKMVE